MGPGSSQGQGSSRHLSPFCVLLRSYALSGGSLVNLLDGAKDHRRGPLDGPAHQVPGAVAMMDLARRLSTGTGSPSGLVVMSQ